MGKALIAWSSGKDSAWTLRRLRAAGTEVAGLFSTIDEEAGRVSVHAVPLALVEAQARAAGLPLHRIPLPQPCPNALYERALGEFVSRMRDQGITQIAFGDLYLDDIRRYRERQFAQSGVELLFPLWGERTRVLADEMVAAGLRARIVCVDPAQAPREWAGQSFDAGFLERVPEGIDPCGERGEFHTFACAGPMFREPIGVRVQGVEERAGLVYARLAEE